MPNLLRLVAGWPLWLVVVVVALGLVVLAVAFVQRRSLKITKQGVELGAPAAAAESEQDAVPLLPDRCWQEHVVQKFGHERLLGAEATVADIQRRLLDESAPRALTISGGGGIGKTTLTIEAVDGRPPPTKRGHTARQIADQLGQAKVSIPKTSTWAAEPPTRPPPNCSDVRSDPKSALSDLLRSITSRQVMPAMGSGGEGELQEGGGLAQESVHFGV